MVLGDANALPLDDLDIVEATKNLMLYLKLGTHSELSSLFDFEWVIFEGFLRSGSGEFNGDRRASGRVHRQGQDDALAWVVGIRNALSTGSKTERLFVLL